MFEASFSSSPNIGTQTEVDNLLKQIKSDKFLHSTSVTNDGCKVSFTKYKNIQWLEKQITDKTNELVTYYKKVDEIFHKPQNKSYQIHYWTNVNQPGSRNVIHSHKDSIFSGVYYIQVEGTGGLRFINPANILSDCNVYSPFVRDFYFTPKDKDLVMWPAWVPHEVDTNNSKKQRINIAFDIILV